MQANNNPESFADDLDQQAIDALLQKSASKWLKEITIQSEVDSTNDWLWRRHQASDINGLVCVAEQQTAGRGQYDRHWHSVASGSLMFSLGWQPATEFDLSRLPQVIGRTLVHVLRNLGFDSVTLKSPNDLMVANKKLGGILTEVRSRGSASICVIGVGVNVSIAKISTNKIDRPWCDLRSLGYRGDRNQILAAFLNQLTADLSRYEHSLQQMISEWPTLSTHSGETAPNVNNG